MSSFHAFVIQLPDKSSIQPQHQVTIDRIPRQNERCGAVAIDRACGRSLCRSVCAGRPRRTKRTTTAGRGRAAHSPQSSTNSIAPWPYRTVPVCSVLRCRAVKLPCCAAPLRTDAAPCTPGISPCVRSVAAEVITRSNYISR